MSLYRSYDMAYCDRCKGERPHSRRGRCLASHRTSLLRRGERLRYTPPPAHTERWEAVKRAVWERDGWACVWPLGRHDGGLDAHHRIGRGVGGSSDDAVVYGLDNIVALCRNHHDHAHGRGRAEAVRLGFVIPRAPAVAATSVPLVTATGHVWLLPDGGRRTGEPA